MARITVNAALLVDAIGCFAGACLFLISTAAWSWTDLPGGWRLPVVVALFAFSVFLVIAAQNRHRMLVALAVVGNIAWITAGAIALFVTGTLVGGVIIALVMVADAAMAWLQSQGVNQPDEEAPLPTTSLENFYTSGSCTWMVRTFTRGGGGP